MTSARTASAPVNLRRTALYDLHLRHQARMVAFAGFEMPIQYSGLKEEHLHTRRAAGLFDVSHMGQFAVTARSGRMSDAAIALETLVPSDILNLPAGRQRYSLLTNDAGGVIDDLMVANLGDEFLLIVNASRVAADEAHIRAKIESVCTVRRLEDRSLVALQGPLAERALLAADTDVGFMKFMDVRRSNILSNDCIISRSGYTGEDGFEISLSDGCVNDFVEALIDQSDVWLVGIGARDSLRLEAGLCLYGADLSEEITPIEASLEWCIQKSRRLAGVRAGGFPGAERILRELENGPRARRIGLTGELKVPARAGTKLFSLNGEHVGSICSGSFSPTMNAPIAMAYVNAKYTSLDSVILADVRDKRVPMRVTNLPFVPHHYK